MDERQFIPGVIQEIQLKNFMTYLNCTIRPGKEFNVILGPNGSGKSSIVSAIVIGLGGDISTLRRQKHLGDLVNNQISEEDGQAAEIKINLLKTSQTVYEIYCRISRENVVTYKVDGKYKDKKEVAKLANSLQIQTENMCQFLPQDRVREFPEMKPDQIFQNSLKAVGNLKMLELNKEAESFEAQRRQFEQNIETKSATITTTARQYSQKKNIIEDMERRKELEDRIAILELHKLELEANICKATCLKALTQNKSKSEELKKAEKEEKRLTALLQDYHKEKQERTNKITETRKKLNELQIKIKSPRADMVREQINDLEKKYKNIKREMNESTSKRKDIEAELVKLNNELKQFDCESLEQEKRKLTEQLNKLEYQKEVQMSELKHCNDEYDTAFKREQNSLVRLRKAQNDIKSEELRRYKRLEIRNADARKGVEWLKLNRSRFKEPKKIYEPIMTVIKLKENFLDYAVQLETIIGSNELEAFVCENNDDANLLMRELRRTYYKINVVHSASGTTQEFQRPEWHKKSQIPIKYCFLDEIIDSGACPDAVMVHLKKKKRIHQIPIFEKETDYLANYCDRYFVGKRLFTFSSSRYSKEKLEKCDNLENTVSQYLNVSDDGSDEDKLKEITKTWEANKKQAEEYDKKRQTFHVNIEKSKITLKEVQGKLDEIKTQLKRKDKVSWYIDEKKSLLKSISGGNLKAELDECAKSIRDEVIKLPNCQQEILDLMQKSSEFLFSVELGELKLQQLEIRYEKRKRTADDATSKFQSLKEECLELRNTHTKQKARLENICKELSDKGWKREWKSDRSDGPYVMECREKLMVEFNNAIPKELPKVGARIDTLTGELSELRPISVTERQKIEELIERKKSGEKELKSLQNSLKDIETQIEYTQKQMDDGTNDMLDTINTHFSNLMNTLGYAGMVQKILTDDNKNGLRILVKFRATEDLTQLSFNAQSGGEKSVATALYIIALQEMTQVPFRCVDEINQGMDDSNERQVWRLLAKTADESSSQFIYLAPKFPKNLEFDDSMLCHICYNGDVLKNDYKMPDLDKIIEAKRKQKNNKNKRRKVN